MLQCMKIQIDEICRYPVKGLAADIISETNLVPGEGLPYDRRWGIIHASSDVDPAAPAWAPKKNFLMLARDEKLAQLGLEFDEENGQLTITRKGKPVSRGVIRDHIGRQTLQTFLSAFMPTGSRGMPKIVEAPASDGFTDTQPNFVSLINLASVKDLEERVLQQPVHPHRFRGNLYFSGATPWVEGDWIAKKIKIGDVILAVEEMIGRCAATNVNPENGEVDMNVPLSLRRGFGHMDMGIYARVIEGGTIRQGDEITLVD
ncbi:hypothetical protein DFP90_10877 [Aestuariispira insulae]|uniref:MOSC domain-containing protein n=2 Tax=Aestuariispira insulae TaxID=1461337 RepID=A0A3D9HF02_9PROT|nr:hypothetical protein DFP90_10877 [Aestuariispira insulae]